MKKTHLAILAILTIVLALMSGQVFAQVALARSYEDTYTPRLYAGFGVAGTSTWSTPGLTRFKYNNIISKTYFDNSTGDCTLNEWGIAGRWYVCRFNPTKGFIIADVASSQDVITTEEPATADAKALKGATGQTTSMTPMIRDAYLEYSSESKSFYWVGTGACVPAGKFNTIKLRVMDAAAEEENFYYIGDTGTGYWKVARSYNAKELVNGKGKFGPYCEAIWHITDPNIDVKIVTNCLYDIARFDFQITNLSANTYNVGFAMTGAANVWEDTSTTYFDKGDESMDWYVKHGSAYYYMPGVGMATRPRTLSGDQIPDKMDVYGYYYSAGEGLDQYDMPVNGADLVSSSSFYFKGNDATAPSYLTIDDSYHLFGMGTYIGDCIAGFWYDGVDAWHDDGGFPTATVWPENGPSRKAYTPDSTFAFQEYEYKPTVYMVTWKTQELSPSKTRRIITYYGENNMDFASGTTKNNTFRRDSFITMVECPSIFGYNAGSDDTVTPEEFTVTARIANCSSEKTSFDIQNISVTIDLPEKGEEGYCGLVLADGETATKKIGGTLKRQSNASVSWQVRVVGDFSGDATFKVTSKGSYIGNPSYEHPELDTDVWTQVVNRTVAIPTTKSGTIDQDWTLAANPFHSDENYTNDDVYGEGNTLLYYWDPLLGSSGRYVQSKALSKITPGQGYWIGKDAGMKTIDFLYPESAVPNEIDTADSDYIKDRHVSLYKGWNIVGNPFTYPAQWLTCNVRNKRTGDVCTIPEAVDQKWMGSAVYGWNQEKYGYNLQNTVKAQLLPNTGYWVYVYEDLEMIYNPASIPGSQITIDGTKYPLGLKE